MQACFLQGVSQLTVLTISNNRVLTFLWKQFKVVKHLSEPFSISVHFTGLALCRFLAAPAAGRYIQISFCCLFQAYSIIKQMQKWS